MSTSGKSMCDFGCQVNLTLPTSKSYEVESDSSSDSYGLETFLFHLQDRLSSKSTTSDDCSTISRVSRSSSLTSETGLDESNLATQSSSHAYDILDQVLRRNASERLAEIQSIGERHITSGDARRNLETFFRQSIHTSSQVRNGSYQNLGESGDGLEDLFQRLSEDRRRELARLQNGERLLTLSRARSNLEEFFTTTTQRDEEAFDIGRVRPTQVHNDVQSLRQQNLVQAALQNGSFRSQLERTLGGRSTNQGVLQIPRQSRERVPSNTVRGSMSNNQAAVNIENVLPRRQHRVLSTVADVTGNNSESNMSERGRQRFPNENIQNEMELLAQTISEDISTLESLQIVNNILQTDFRNRLENLINDRVQTVGNGPAVQEFIQSLPGTRTVGSNRSARSQQILGRNVVAEMQNLGQQLDEMKRMVDVTFELQVDTQRVIRQEVSAIFNAFMQDYLKQKQHNGSTTIPQHDEIISKNSSSNIPVASGQCVVCTERKVDSVLYQCGHMCVCLQCGIHLNMEGHKCPMCRAPIRDVIRAYQTQSDSY